VTLHLQPVKLDHERMMDCIHCGLCLSQCPTYAEEGLEADSPRGRIYLMRALAEGRAQPTPEVTQHFDSCLGCRACETACPSGVQYGHLLENTREFLRATQPTPLKKGLTLRLLESTFPYPNRLDALMVPVRIGRKLGLMPLLHRLGIMKLFGPLGTMEASLPPLRPTGAHKKLPEEFAARGEEQARVGMITGCVLPVLQGQINDATAQVLAHAGARVFAPKNQKCCGALHAHSGDMNTARDFARHNIEQFETFQQENGALDAVIINAAGCGAALKEYPNWFHGDEAWEERARNFSSLVRDVSEFLAQPAFKERLQEIVGEKAEQVLAPQVLAPTRDAPRESAPNTSGASTLPGVSASSLDERAAATDSETATTLPHEKRSPTSTCRVTYHDACHLAHGQGVRVPPRELAQMAAQAQSMAVVPLPESEMCCGSAGTYNILQPEMANRLLERKMKNIASTGANVVLSANIGCTLQLKGGARKCGVPVEVLHPVEFLARAIEESNAQKRS
jgi:glycolate oxidase iron-sulfur subunit